MSGQVRSPHVKALGTASNRASNLGCGRPVLKGWSVVLTIPGPRPFEKSLAGRWFLANGLLEAKHDVLTSVEASEDPPLDDEDLDLTRCVPKGLFDLPGASPERRFERKGNQPR